MIESQIKQWDGETVILHFDHPTGAWIIIAVHSTRLGPATGGTRMKHYSTLNDAVGDALKLAKGMTYKFAVPGLPLGGGKAVINLPESFDQSSRPDLLRRYGSLIKQLGGLYYTGSDVGTSSSDMDIIAETGAPYVFSRTPSAGGAGSSGPFTAIGVFAGIQVACEHLYGEPSLKGRKVLVQGTGSVGGTLIDLLVDADADVLFSEVDEVQIKHYRDDKGLNFVPVEEVFVTECDVFSPCALGGVLNSVTISMLKCRAVVGGANNQLTEPEDGERLQKAGVLYAPDYVVNVGGAMGITGMETLGWSKVQAEKNVTETVRETLHQVFSLVESENITPEVAAQSIADERLSAS